MKLKSEKLLLLLPIVVIANSIALYLWIKLGWTIPTLIATLLGIGMILSFVLINRFYKYLQDNRYFIIGSAILVVMVGMYLWRGKGIPYIGIYFALLGMCILFMVVLKGKWRNICCIAALVLGGIVFIFGHKEVNQAPTPAIEEVGVIKPGAVNRLASKNRSPGSAVAVSRDMVNMMHRIFPSEQLEDPAVQEIMEVIASDSFQEKLEQHNPKTMDEYIHFIVSQGFTDLSEADFHKVLDAGYQVAEADYKAKNSSKNPETEDDVMKHRLVTAMEEFGLLGGIEEFMKDRNNVIWVNARFKGDREAYHKWWMGMRSLYERRNLPTLSSSSTTNVETSRELQESTSSDEGLTQSPFAETETAPADRASTDLWDESTRSVAEPREVTTSVVDPEKAVTQMSPELPALPTDEDLEITLKERFSSERFERAMSSLEQYGPEEGLRRLRESDPEIAKQIEDSRNGVENSRRAGVEQHRDRLGEEENSR